MFRILRQNMYNNFHFEIVPEFIFQIKIQITKEELQGGENLQLKIIF